MCVLVHGKLCLVLLPKIVARVPAMTSRPDFGFLQT